MASNYTSGWTNASNVFGHTAFVPMGSTMTASAYPSASTSTLVSYVEPAYIQQMRMQELKYQQAQVQLLAQQQTQASTFGYGYQDVIGDLKRTIAALEARVAALENALQKDAPPKPTVSNGAPKKSNELSGLYTPHQF